jgi:hypothetical protein
LFHADGQMDRHDKANSRFSQFCESAYKLGYLILLDGDMIIDGEYVVSVAWNSMCG